MIHFLLNMAAIRDATNAPIEPFDELWTDGCEDFDGADETGVDAADAGTGDFRAKLMPGSRVIIAISNPAQPS
jgi:hypothetical protein